VLAGALEKWAQIPGSWTLKLRADYFESGMSSVRKESRGGTRRALGTEKQVKNNATAGGKASGDSLQT